MNHVLPNPISATDYRFGGISGITDSPLQVDGNWELFLPVIEKQYFPGYDAMDCVTFSALNCLETLHKRKYGIELNWSDRFTAKMSGTTDQGNYLYKVGDSIRKDGLVLESQYPSIPPPASFKDYYADIPAVLINDAKNFLTQYQVAYETVPNDRSAILAALKIAPLQIVIDNYSHAVMLYNAQDGVFLDTFDSERQALMRYDWSFGIDFVYKYSLNKITPMLQIGENSLVFLAENPGGFALKVGDSLIIDDLAKLQAQFIMRNNGDIKGKTISLTLADWNSFPHKDLRGNPLP